LEGDLQLPAQDEPLNDLDGFHDKLGAQQRLPTILEQIYNRSQSVRYNPR
jgi:hypothetical protein